MEMKEDCWRAGWLAVNYTTSNWSSWSASGQPVVKDCGQASQPWSASGQPVVNQWSANGQPVVSEWSASGQPVVTQWSASGQPVVSQSVDDAACSQYGDVSQQTAESRVHCISLTAPPVCRDDIFQLHTLHTHSFTH